MHGAKMTIPIPPKTIYNHEGKSPAITKCMENSKYEARNKVTQGSWVWEDSTQGLVHSLEQQGSKSKFKNQKSKFKITMQNPK